MPVLTSSYRPAPFFRNGHVQSIWASVARRVPPPPYRRERIDTPDGDFLDLDWSVVGASRLAILSHGLEGDTDRPYMRGMVRALNRAGWDALAWHLRGCSGEPNRLPRFYHSGATEDLDAVVGHALATGRYARVALVGFSLGGNLTLAYAGGASGAIDPRIRNVVAFSVPCDLAASAGQLALRVNAVYMRRFLRSLRKKIADKRQRFPGGIDDGDLTRIRTFHEFDGRFTAPLHGFRDAEDYWERCSSRRFFPGIEIPTLLVNAADDPFLAGGCYPIDEAHRHPHLYLEVPAYGGHVGFVDAARDGLYWSERRAVAFLEGETA